MSSQILETHKKARIRVLQHASTQHLVTENELTMEEWAKDFARHKYLYEEVTKLLHANDQGDVCFDIKGRVEKAFKAGDIFILENADMSQWDGHWVLAHWRAAAIERQEEGKEEREKREQMLADLNVKLDKLFNIPVDEYKFNDSNANETGLSTGPGRPRGNATKSTTTVPTTRARSSVTLKRKEVSVEEGTPGSSSSGVKRMRKSQKWDDTSSLGAPNVPLNGYPTSGSHSPAGTCKELLFNDQPLSEDLQSMLASIGANFMETLEKFTSTTREQINASRGEIALIGLQSKKIQKGNAEVDECLRKMKIQHLTRSSGNKQ